MNKIRGSILAVHFLAGIVTPARAAFEQIGAGARPIGMANAFTAVSDDAHAIHYNPAGLAQVRRGEFTGGYGKLYSGLKDNSNLGSGFVGVVQPVKAGQYGTLGLGWISLSLEGAYREDSINFSYGKEVLADGFFVGASGKVLKRNFGKDAYTQMDPLFISNGYNTTNLSFDFGVMYRPNVNYSFGFTVKDLNQPNVGLAASDKVPAEIRGGFAYHQKTLLFDAEISKKDKDTNVAIGLEKILLKMFALRTGIGGGARNRREITMGLGYRGGNLGLDYAFLFPLGGIESTAGTHRFSMSVRFGRVPDRARWDFEEDSEMMERLLEEKSAQIASMERELEGLKDQTRSGKLESNWVRDQIKKLEERIHDQETNEMEQLKNRVFQSNVETEKMRQKVRDLEQRIQQLSNQAKSAPVAEPKNLPAVPRTYKVLEGETLQSIAEKLYGDPAKWVEIYELNADRVERGGSLTTGQVLLMPER
ncbi:MAG: hypothetical protein A2901_04290 [Elusimicrobia bacterium RIFCSPLOWO2_01_FULL_54_10]|nr:MAG: hypothetical protein A2901_04290 [Elusimicrobia bacterium RIFCSPLOWO2_01_FULL_54_10]